MTPENPTWWDGASEVEARGVAGEDCVHREPFPFCCSSRWWQSSVSDQQRFHTTRQRRRVSIFSTDLYVTATDETECQCLHYRFLPRNTIFYFYPEEEVSLENLHSVLFRVIKKRSVEPLSFFKFYFILFYISF